MQTTIKALDDFKRANEKHKAIASGLGTPATIWEAPSGGWLKANWDAGINVAQNRTGFGVVIRDSYGNLFAASCACRQGSLDPSVAEILGAIMAVQLCRDLDLMRVHFEGDAKTVVEAINSTDVDWSSWGHLVADVHMELQELYQWKCTHVRRDGNLAAHTLAKYAIQNAVEKRWCDDLPECIKELLSLERSDLTR
jgi:ribonuclease HI